MTKDELFKKIDTLEELIELLILYTAPTMEQYLRYYFSQGRYEDMIEYLKNN